MNTETPPKPVESPTNNETPKENPFSVQAALEANKPKEPTWLDKVVTGKRSRPVLMVVYGSPGVGKSTFGSTTPNPIFIPTERGLDQIGSARFPQPKTFAQFKEMCTTVANTKNDYLSLVVDTADGLEALIWEEVCAEANVPSIEKIPYGKGFDAAKTKWRTLLKSFERLSEKMNVVILCHSHIKTVNDPSLSDPYDMHKMKLHDKSAEILRDFCDNVLFACYEITLSKDDQRDKKGRGLHSGNRILKTSANTGFEAKNRFNLPDEIPLEWSAVQKGIDSFYAK